MDDTGGHTFGGSPILYHYTLVLQRGPAGPSCMLHLEGYQQDEQLRCTAHGDPSMLDVAFASYANGSLVNMYGIRVYRPGTVLFRLNRAGTGNSAALATAWLALHPDGLAKTGAFFRREDP